MACDPKQRVQIQDEDDNEMKGAKETKRRRATKDHFPIQRFVPNHQNYWSSHNPYFTSTPSMPILWSQPLGMFGCLLWPHFDSWMSYEPLYHGGLFPDNYVFEL
jgi:hypothetical protein